MDVLMEWKGKKLEGYREIVDHALKLEGKEQEEFVEKYCSTGIYARQNIGYVSGYYDNDTADRIMKIFKTSHPIFGSTHPAPEEAFEMGKRMAQAFKEGQK